MSCSCCPPPASEYRRFFRRAFARSDLRRYRRKGLPKTAQALAAAVDGSGETVLEIGGGIGSLALELVERGAAHATVIEISDGYDEVAGELVAERGLGDKVERRIGDFVAEADLVEAHDVVLLHRVICCYPDADALVSTAAAHARRSLAFTVPQERPLLRLAFRGMNLWLRLRRCGFRAYVHPFRTMETAAEREGLTLARRETQGMIWQNAVFERAPASAG